MKKSLAVFLAAVLALVFMAPMAAARPDKDHPSPATNVELVKKVTLKGKPVGGGKPARPAATGILGENCTGSKYAIVIGISDYPGEENDLNYSDDDARDMYDALINRYGYDKENIHLLIDGNATYENIRGSIGDLKSKAKAGDEVVFFFSGHGAKGQANDGDNERIDEAIVAHNGSALIFIWDGDLKELFSGFNTTRIIFIFDSCLAGGMTDLQAPGRIINMACSESGVSYESDAWGNGQFTYYFVDQGMLKGLADTYDSVPSVPDVTVEEAFDYARANCVMQKPTISDLFDNDLLL